MSSRASMGFARGALAKAEAPVMFYRESLAGMAGPAPAAAPADAMEVTMAAPTTTAPAGGEAAPPMAEPTVRTNFADTAFWAAALTTAALTTVGAALRAPSARPPARAG